MSSVRYLLKQVLPPAVVGLVSRLYHLLGVGNSGLAPWGEKSQSWYDGEYRKQASYRRHYTESGYYFVWTVIVDRLMRYGAKQIIDVGCGPGQFAGMLADKGISGYLGIDLSEEAIRLARRNCPSFKFVVADVFKCDLLEKETYDCLVSLECLEHVQEDLALLGRVRSGTHCFFTVPNFPYVSHVRHFQDEKDVKSRYGELFIDLEVTTILGNSSGTKYFLAEGTRI